MRRLTKKASRPKSGEAAGFLAIAAQLCEVGRTCYARGWALGTSGNYSAVIRRAPLRVAITPSGADKGALTAGQILAVDARGKVIRGSGQPSSEWKLHLTIIRARAAGAVLHSHSVWSTLLSKAFAGQGGLWIEGYEMLKGLDGVSTYEHREWLPIIENSQDWVVRAPAIEELLESYPGLHGFLIRGHGLYTWGSGLAEARRHSEILEFLLEVFGRARLRRSNG